MSRGAGEEISVASGREGEGGSAAGRDEGAAGDAPFGYADGASAVGGGGGAMSWLVTVLAAVLGAVVGGAGMLGIALISAKWYRITGFEGAIGYYVVMMMAVGGVGGLVIGAAASRVAVWAGGQAWVGWGQIGAAMGAIAAALVLVLVIAYLGGEHERERAGRGLVIAWEVRLPAGEPGPDASPAQWTDEQLRMQVVSVVRGQPRGSAEAVLDRSAFRVEDGQWVLPARVGLFTSRGELCVNLKLGGVGWDDGFWPRLSPAPGKERFEWSQWERTNKGREKASDREAVMYRFRFERGGSGDEGLGTGGEGGEGGRGGR